MHTWNFFRAGGFDQVRLDSGADLLALKELDQKLWVALGCPTRGREFDPKTLDLIDSDADGHVRACEVLAAVDWAGKLLKNADLPEGANRSLFDPFAEKRVLWPYYLAIVAGAILCYASFFKAWH